MVLDTEASSHYKGATTSILNWHDNTIWQLGGYFVAGNYQNVSMPDLLEVSVGVFMMDKDFLFQCLLAEINVNLAKFPGSQVSNNTPERVLQVFLLLL